MSTVPADFLHEDDTIAIALNNETILNIERDLDISNDINFQLYFLAKRANGQAY